MAAGAALDATIALMAGGTVAGLKAMVVLGKRIIKMLLPDVFGIAVANWVCLIIFWHFISGALR